MKILYLKSVAMSATLVWLAGTALPTNVFGQPADVNSSASSSIQEASGAPSTGASREKSNAKFFIQKTAAENNFEIILGQLAQLKAENPQVRQLGQQLSQEHQAANQKLEALAQQHGMPLGVKEFAQITQASPQQFDQTYVQFVTKGGRDGLQQLQHIANNHPDRDVQQFARDQVAQMQRSLAEAQRVQTELQAGGQIEEPAGAEREGSQGLGAGAQDPQAHYAAKLQERAEGRHYPSPQGTIITEQAGAESPEQFDKKIQRLEQQVRSLQQQVQELQNREGLRVQGGSNSQGQPAHVSAAEMPMPEAREFIMTGVAYGKLCTALSQLAMERAQSPAVKQLAQQQQLAGLQSKQQLQRLARQFSVPMDNQNVEQLVRATGRDFDQAYTRLIVQEHQRALQDLERAASEPGDPAVQQFARGQIPTMQKHMEFAERLQTQIQSNSGIREPAGASGQREYRDLRELLTP